MVFFDGNSTQARKAIYAYCKGKMRSAGLKRIDGQDEMSILLADGRSATLTAGTPNILNLSLKPRDAWDGLRKELEQYAADM